MFLNTCIFSDAIKKFIEYNYFVISIFISKVQKFKILIIIIIY